MASLLDFFTPGASGGAQPDQNIMPSISTFMNDPRSLSALLAFGTQAMIPQWGGGGVQLAKGIGAAGETLDRQEEEKRKQQEADSKSELRAAQATKAEAGATAAAARSDSAAQRLALETFRQGEVSKRNELGRKVALSGMYQKYLNDVIKRNNDPLRPVGQAPEPLLPMDQWIQANPLLKNMGFTTGAAPQTDEGDTGDATLPPGAAATASSESPPQGQRQVGQKWTPTVGPNAGKTFTWNGSQWTL